jgi:hypothetical protein
MPESLETAAEDLAVRDEDTLAEVEVRGARWPGIQVSGLPVSEALLARL